MLGLCPFVNRVLHNSPVPGAGRRGDGGYGPRPACPSVVRGFVRRASLPPGDMGAQSPGAREELRRHGDQVQLALIDAARQEEALATQEQRLETELGTILAHE